MSAAPPSAVIVACPVTLIAPVSVIAPPLVTESVFPTLAPAMSVAFVSVTATVLPVTSIDPKSALLLIVMLPAPPSAISSASVPTVIAPKSTISPPLSIRSEPTFAKRISVPSASWISADPVAVRWSWLNWLPVSLRRMLPTSNVAVPVMTSMGPESLKAAPLVSTSRFPLIVLALNRVPFVSTMVRLLTLFTVKPPVPFVSSKSLAAFVRLRSLPVPTLIVVIPPTLNPTSAATVTAPPAPRKRSVPTVKVAAPPEFAIAAPSCNVRSPATVMPSVTPFTSSVAPASRTTLPATASTTFGSSANVPPVATVKSPAMFIVTVEPLVMEAASSTRTPPAPNSPDPGTVPKSLILNVLLFMSSVRPDRTIKLLKSFCPAGSGLLMTGWLMSNARIMSSPSDGMVRSYGSQFWSLPQASSGSALPDHVRSAPYAVPANRIQAKARRIL